MRLHKERREILEWIAKRGRDGTRFSHDNSYYTAEYLVKIGLAEKFRDDPRDESPGREHFRITEAGEEALKQPVLGRPTVHESSAARSKASREKKKTEMETLLMELSSYLSASHGRKHSYTDVAGMTAALVELRGQGEAWMMHEFKEL